ncbi:MAG: MaoC family dehydratase [Microscillaceae bacterium]|nr:MaoC family dehydratase [Microscillaceae bacterium]MDW8461380.1 MaoC family dehydratase [Cytophagales bacterium]
MKIFNNAQELKEAVGQEIGTSNWLLITQERINDFAKATEDFQWIHIDEERAKKELPWSSTIAHGFLTLSLAPKFMYELYEVKNTKMALNYGTNKVRFTSPVPVGSYIRMKAVLSQVEEVESGIQITMTLTFERQGQEKPVCVAEMLSRFYF